MARTWFVERDGSGDYTVIQDAVDVAASGDTIRIGTGRFDEKRFVTSQGWSDSVCVLVDQNELTIIGSGTETRIGQDRPWAIGQGYPRGIVASDYWGNKAICICNLQVENMYDGIYKCDESGGDSNLDVSDCLFNRNQYAITANSAGGIVYVESCIFEYTADDGIHVHGWNQSMFSVVRCAFLLNNIVYGQSSLGLVNVQNSLIEDCEFSGGTVGAIVTYGGPARFLNCTFEDQQNVALYPSAGSYIVVEECAFRNQTRVVESGSGDNRVSMTGSNIADVTDCSFLIAHLGTVFVDECDLAKGERGVVWIVDSGSCPTVQHLDCTVTVIT